MLSILYEINCRIRFYFHHVTKILSHGILVGFSFGTVFDQIPIITGNRLLNCLQKGIEKFPLQQLSNRLSLRSIILSDEISFFFTTRIRSVREGNVFSRVYLSVSLSNSLWGVPCDLSHDALGQQCI